MRFKAVEQKIIVVFGNDGHSMDDVVSERESKSALL